jgi:4-amino-4-deoxy-L-arabinose transferase-like glycosyltransferase
MKAITKNYTFLFFLVLVGLILVNNFIDILFAPPYGWHTWRQTDGLSIALNYYNNPDISFFEPAIHCHNANDMNKGVGEFPIIYYIVAQIWKITGVQYWVYRSIMFIIGFSGVYLFSKAIADFTKNKHIGILITLFLFSSPVYLTYMSSFTPNVAAFSFSLMAWAFFFQYIKKEKFYVFILSVAFISIASLLKVTEAVSLVIMFAIIFLEKIKLVKFEKQWFSKTIIYYFLVGAVSVMPSYLWYSFARQYNSENQSDYFSLRVWNAIWQDNFEGPVSVAWDKMTTNTLWQNHSKLTLILLLIAFVYSLFHWKKANKLFKIVMVLGFGWSAFYFLTFFYVFVWHDYYLVGFLIFTVFIVITTIDLLFKNYSNQKRITIGLYVVFIFLSYTAAIKGRLRYNNEDALAKSSKFLVEKSTFDLWDYDAYRAKITTVPFYTIQPYLRSIGIKANDKVFVMNDFSPSISLALMNQYGYTNMFITIEDMNKTLPKLKSKGLNYLLIIESDEGAKNNVKKLDSMYLQNKIGQYQTVAIYKL